MKELQSICPEALHPYDGIGGFTAASPSFAGKTLFRFPLRKKPSKLSNSICTILDIKQLLEALKTEAKYLLLFLRSVCSIEIIEVSEFGKETSFKVSISPRDALKHQRQQQSLVNQVEATFTGSSPYLVKQIIQEKSQFSIEIQDGESITKHDWLVVHRVGSENDEVLALAKQQHVLPWVGTAFEISQVGNQLGGRIFCVLPLPIEDRAPFNVSVNGTFAVSSNRRSLNWESQERKEDNEGKWNKYLVEKCIPHCYAELVQELIKLSSITPETVYNCWPVLSQARRTPWEGMLQPLFQMMLYSSTIVHTSAGNGQWIGLSDAVFVSNNERSLPVCLREVLISTGTKLVVIPPDQWNAVSNYYKCSLTEIAPSRVRSILKKNQHAYSELPRCQKLEILKYCLSDNCYDDLNGLQLIPLANGSFGTFQLSRYMFFTTGHVYVCTSSISHNLLPNLDHIMVNVLDDSISHSLLHKVATSSTTQLTVLTVSEVAKLVAQSRPQAWSQPQINVFWRWLQRYVLKEFEGLNIVPVKSLNGEVSVQCLSKPSCVVYVSRYISLPDSLRVTLEKYGVKMALEIDFPYLSHSDLTSYLNQFEAGEVLDSISLHVIPRIKLTDEQSSTMQSFLAGARTSFSNNSRINKICAMSLFSVIQNHSRYSINELKTREMSNKALAQGDGFYFKTNLLPNRSPLIFKDEQPLLNNYSLTPHVTVINGIECLQKVAFVSIRNGFIDKRSASEFMVSVLKNLQTFIQRYPGYRNSLPNSISNLPFVNVESGNQMQPCALFDPRDQLLLRLYKGEAVFPSDVFTDYIHELSLCGLRGSGSVNAQMMTDIIVNLQSNSYVTTVQCSDIIYTMIQAFFEFLNKYPNILDTVTSSSFYNRVTFANYICQRAKSYAILPIASTRPMNYPSCLTWKGASIYNNVTTKFDASQVIVLPNTIRHTLPNRLDLRIIGSEVFFVEKIPLSICQQFTNNDLSACVVRHFKHVIEKRIEMDNETLEDIATRTYEYLNSCSLRSVNLQSVVEWVWVDSCSSFVRPDMCALNMNPSFRSSLEPFVYVLPNKMKNYENLLCHFGVQKSITNKQIISVLNCIKNRQSKICADEAMSLVKNILEWVVQSKYESDDLLVPIDSGDTFPDLYAANEVSYTDNEILLDIAKTSGDEYKLVHHSVAHLASQLGLTPLSDQLDITEEVFQDAGQHEPLTTRLSNILKEYTDGLTIIKELIQNADDAEATEVNILYDARDHTRSRLLFKGMADSHGPALIVHNNATFTKEDFENITKLAGATKKDKPLKIGKFGVGFCSVYHITDVPSFVSDDWLYIFDPTLSHLKGAVKNENQPGKKVRFLSKFIARTEQLVPYKNLYGFDPNKPYKGTMFRFPFRRHASQISSTIYNEVMINQLRNALAEKGGDMLLFLSNVKKVTFSSLRNGNASINEEITISREECIDENVVSVKTNDCQSSEPVIEYYLVSTKIGEAYDENRMIHPSVSSVACCLSKNASGQYQVLPVDGLTFCFLPLPASAKTGLPVHINANFAVMSNRRGICTTTTSGWWNQQLMVTIIPEAYCRLLLMLKSLHEQDKLLDYKFFSLFPLTGSLLIQSPWESMITCLYEQALLESLLYSTFLGSWLKLEESKFLSHSILSLNETTSPKCVIDSIHIMKLGVIDLPHKYLSELELNNKCSLHLLDQYAFCKTFMLTISKFFDNIEVRNEVILKILLSAASEIAATETSELTETLKTKHCIPCSPDGVELKLVTSLVDPQSYLKDLFDVESRMFPIASFCEKTSVRKLMIEIGLITSNLPWNIVLECAKSIRLNYQQDQVKCLKKIKILIKVIEENIKMEERSYSSDKKHTASESQKYIDQLKKVEFIPVAIKPDDCILPWKATGIGLSSPSEMFYPHPTSSTFSGYYSTPIYSIKRECCILGAQKILVNSLPIEEGGCGKISHCVIKKLEFQNIPDFDDVLRNYQSLIEEFQKKREFADKEIENIEYICRMTYEFMNNELKKRLPYPPYSESNVGSAIVDEEKSEMETKLSEFQDKPFIWSENDFIPPENVAVDWRVKGPCLYALPPIISGRKLLINALCIKEKFSIVKLLNTLRKMSNEFEKVENESYHQYIVDAIINELNTHKLVDFDNIDESNIILPSSSYVFSSSKDLSFNDSQWLPVVNDCVLVHKTLSREIALRLGVKAIRSQFLDKYNTSIAKFGGTQFGQKEELTQRIQNILRDYPFDVTLIKELLQNADDAKATKMCIILDKRKHGKEKIPSEEWSSLQGPALLVWNNEEFTEEDLEGIQKLGLGSKRDDIESIGQFGIGFNVVYHVTDCPSLISGGKTLCVFDPHCKYVPGADVENPGRRYDNLEDEFWDAMSDLRDAYFQSEPINDQPSGINKGSLFRFPLRSTHAHILESKIVCDPVTARPLSAKDLERKLDKWILQIKDALVFLNHITEFSYYVVDSKGFHLCAQYKVAMDEAAVKTRTDLFTGLREFKKGRRPCVFNYQLSMECKESNHILPIRQHNDAESVIAKSQYKIHHEEWFIQQGVGNLEKDPSSQKWRYIRQVLPKHGLAAPISTSTNFEGKIFCFLPLPDTSGLPVHVNGQFVLSSNRRSLWAGDNEGQDEKKEWNDLLMEAIAISYVHFLREARNIFVKDEEYAKKDLFFSHINRYYSLYPIVRKDPKTEMKFHLEKNCMRMAELVFKKILSYNSEILAVEIHKKYTQEGTDKPLSTVKVEWSCLNEKQNPFNQVYFQPNCVEKKEIISLLRCIKLKLTCAPNILYKHLIEEDHDGNPVIATRETVFKFYTSYYEQIFTHALPCNIDNSPFKTVDNFHKFIKYLLRSIPKSLEQTFPKDPFGYPLLLTADQVIRCFDKKVITVQSQFFDVFPNSLSIFLHDKFLPVKLFPNYFNKAVDISLSFVNKLLLNNYPSNLQEEQMDNSDNHLETIKLKRLWECLTSVDDQLLIQHQSVILCSWALTPATNRHLYSTRSNILPVFHHPSFSPQIDQKNAFNVLVQIGLPVIDFKCLPDATHGHVLKYFPTMKDYDRVLSVLYHLHKDSNVLANLSPKNNDVQYILNYLARTNFLHDGSLKNQIKSLPLFKSIEGHLTSLLDKKVYLWPSGGFCNAGYSKWAPCESVVFLGYNGEWRHLTEDFNVIGTSLDKRKIYLDLVLPSFDCLSSEERKMHLEYIRDKLFHNAKRESEFSGRDLRYCNAESYRIAVNFVQTLKNLKCIEHPKTNELKIISHFSDHTISIFELFQDNFIFLPKNYCDEFEEWKEFFHDLGLRVKVSAAEFIKFCSEVDKGSHEKLKKASKVLLEYLFEEGKEWSDYDLHRIADISFVTVPNLPHLSWIKVPCPPPNSIQNQSETINFTKLNRSILLENASLIWTVKPVFDPPTLKSPNEFWERNALLEKLHVTLSPCPVDVVKNMVNLSESGLSHFSLFSSYKAEYNCTNDDEKTSVVDIITRSLELLQKHTQECVDLLSCLEDCAWIPVPAKGDSNIRPVQVVLVKPVEVVRVLDSSDQLLKPYINELPNCLSNYFPLLEKIGVRNMIDFIHIQHILETLRSRFKDGKTNDPNEIEKIYCTLVKLNELTSKEYSKKDAVKHLQPLFLPCSAGRSWSLKPSTELLFVDSSRYRSRNPENFDLVHTQYSLFQIPPSSRSKTSRQPFRTQNVLFLEPIEDIKFSEKSLCLSLPNEVSPKALSLQTQEMKFDIGNISNASNIVQAHLTETKRLLNEFRRILPSMLKYHISETSELFNSELFIAILENLEMKVIKGLKVKVSINDACIGMLISPSFLIEKGDNSQYTLYIDERATGEYPFWKEFARSLLMGIATLTKNNATAFFKMIRPIASFLQVHSLSGLEEFGELYQVKLELTDNENEESEEDSFIPSLGKRVPEELISRCSDINNIFRPQEWVCYEISDEYFVWAIVLYPINNNQGGTDGSEPDKYRIQIDDRAEFDDEVNSDGVEVSVLDLYKITSSENEGDDEPTETQDLVPLDESETSAFVKQTRDSQRMKTMKRSVCEELKMIWKLQNEKDRRKAIKRLYLKYHPDKQNPLNRDMYDEVFKFLQRQINRLENGLPLEDPDVVSKEEEESPVSTRSSYWSRDFEQWNTYASRSSSSHHGYSQRRQTSSSGTSFNFNQYQPCPDPREAKRWLKQAHTDCHAMKVLLEEMRTESRLIGDQSSVVCQVIFLAREVVEKSLKAGVYKLVGLNSGYLTNHEIIYHARVICSQKSKGKCLTRIQQSGTISLEDIAIWIDPFYTNSRFPNKHPLYQAPVDVCSEDEAERAAEYAILTINFVESQCD